MAKKRERQHRLSEERKREFMVMFSRESEQIRDSIVKDLPAYNMLLSMNAESFEEIALRQATKERGIVYDKDNPPAPNCPYCGQFEKIGKKNDMYFCYPCGRKFTANYNSISSGTKCDALTWMKVLQCILDFKGISKTCEYCGISETTYYKLRNRLFYGMQLLLNEVKLYGNIEVDNTFVRASFKGSDLAESEFPEESIFFDISFKPRAARSRGGAYSFAEKNANYICVFTAIDDRGHVLTRFAGVGATSLRTLKNYIPADKFLLEVPKKDPFGSLFRPRGKEPKTAAGEKTLIVADMEKAIERYANHIGVGFESHVFRERGVQRRLSDSSHNIQRVNALHHRLKKFLRDTNYVSTKYLPGYLILFEFIENTGATKEAIERLFEILVRPNLGQSASFFQDMFSVPNYLLEWVDGDSPLKKLPYNKLLAFYLYDHIRTKDQYPGTEITMEYIERETGYTAPTIRKIYNNLNTAGYREMILKFFGEPTGGNQKEMKEEKKSEKRKKSDVSSSINPVVLAIFDEYAAIRRLPKSKRITLDELLRRKNEEFGTSYKRTNILAKFAMIVEQGVREPLPDLKNSDRYANGRYIGEKELLVCEGYEKAVLGYKEKGEKVPAPIAIYEELGKKYGLTVQSVAATISAVRRYKREKKL